MVNLLFGDKYLKTRRSIVIVGAVVFLLVGAVAFFILQANKQDVAFLNQKLPKGIVVVKNVFSNYTVVNNIDDYSFTIPKEWKGIESIEYTPERDVQDYRVVSLYVEGNGPASILSVDMYKNITDDTMTFANKIWTLFGLEGKLESEKIGKYDIVMGFEEKNLGGTFVSFLKNQKMNMFVYNNGSEEYLKYIITNGKW